MRVGAGPQLAHVLKGHEGATQTAHGVFEAQQLGCGAALKQGIASLHLEPGHALVGHIWNVLKAASRHATHGVALVVEDVEMLRGQHHLLGLEVGHHRNEIPHGAAVNEERCLFAEEVGESLLQAIDGLVLAVVIHSDVRARHCAYHGLGWHGAHIAAQVDETFHGSELLSSFDARRAPSRISIPGT